MARAPNALTRQGYVADVNPLAESYVPVTDADPGLFGRVMDWVLRQQQISQERGLWTGGQVWQGGRPTVKGVADAAQQYAGNFEGGIKAYHGSPHSFERFDTSKIGTGVGAQPYGRGLYFAGSEDVAKPYRGGPSGHMYEAEIKAEPHQMLDWDLPFAAQGGVGKAAHEISRDLLAKAYQKSGGSAEFAEELMKEGGGLGKPFSPDMTPGDAILWAQAVGVAPADVSKALHAAGIPGLKYSDAAVAGGPAKQNYVVFNADTIDILRKYGIAGLGIGLGAAATQGE